jgi:hypothetical protein
LHGLFSVLEVHSTDQLEILLTLTIVSGVQEDFQELCVAPFAQISGVQGEVDGFRKSPPFGGR